MGSDTGRTDVMKYNELFKTLLKGSIVTSLLMGALVAAWSITGHPIGPFKITTAVLTYEYPVTLSGLSGACVILMAAPIAGAMAAFNAWLAASIGLVIINAASTLRRALMSRHATME